MPRSYAAVILAVGASAAVVARDQCCFQLTASGGASGTVGQLSDGQNRIGGGYPPATYCINNGGITDSSGRGCILTPPTTQFQCDVGASPTTGFGISSSGEVEYNGSTTFYACPAANGIYNIYTTPVANQPKCTKITLSSGGKCVPAKPTPKPSVVPSVASCPAPSTVTVTQQPKPSTVTVTEKAQPWTTTVVEHATCPAPQGPSTVTVTQVQTSAVAPPPPPPGTTEIKTTWQYTTLSPPTTKPAPPPVKSSSVAPPPPPPQSQPSSLAPPKSSPPPTKPSSSACQTELSGAYQTPHLIVPVSSSQPDHAYGTQYNATITSSECTIFNFDIPASYSGKSCSTIFLFPEQSQLETSSFDISGTGSIVFSSLSSAANQQTTWNNAPSKKQQLGSVSPVPGNSYAISTSQCSPGSTQSIEVCGTGSLSLSFFEDWNPSPIGVYVTSC
ncbi:hypothetical protein M409DRAFT_70921 [Zasmidium cellare ATCC 36951]|uniref:Uncharacterized protein n=1 Tax=Zasmidium cellare ATCC 36951 TaxID=1080233 RepID=A0A6A6C0C7_ZASCE|nr:uncharacterized protein M409DRAFT_70921 [Zasmidium cellare ATCC 36951]KAF2159610.1 hypothetical protein M409DRAFT_70921 [Zasmidium cellare ATCC 36951]